MNSTLIASYSIIALYCILALTGLIGNAWVMLTVISQLMGYSTTFPFRHAKGAACGVMHQNGHYAHNHYHYHNRARRRSLVSTVQFSACIYLLLLSVVDLISFVPVPLLAADIVENRWPFGLALCKLLYACEGANKSLSPLVLTALSVDRYVAVCRPNFVWLRQSRFALAVIGICAAISALFILPVTWRATVSKMPDLNLKEHRKCVVEMDHTYDILHTITCYVLPLIFICSVYVSILRRLYRHTRISAVGRRTSISLSRVVKCSVLVVAFYFICWTPYWTMRIISILSLDSTIVDETLATAPSLMTSSTPSTWTVQHAVAHALLNMTKSPFQNITVITTLLRDTDVALLYADAPENVSAFLLVDATTTRATTTLPAKDENFLTTVIEDYRHILLMYLVHALPYTQSAFNWLFYAFLNRNLRQSTRGSQLACSGVHTPLAIDGMTNNCTAPTVDVTPISVRNHSISTALYSPRGSTTTVCMQSIDVSTTRNKMLSFLCCYRWRTKELCGHKTGDSSIKATAISTPFLLPPKHQKSRTNGTAANGVVNDGNHITSSVRRSSATFSLMMPSPTEISIHKKPAQSSPNKTLSHLTHVAVARRPTKLSWSLPPTFKMPSASDKSDCVYVTPEPRRRWSKNDSIFGRKSLQTSPSVVKLISSPNSNEQLDETSATVKTECGSMQDLSFKYSMLFTSKSIQRDIPQSETRQPPILSPNVLIETKVKQNSTNNTMIEARRVAFLASDNYVEEQRVNPDAKLSDISSEIKWL